MTHAARFLLAAILCAAPALGAQTSAPNPGPAASVPTMKTWLFRLTPPRPTFDKDITQPEQDLMQAHYLYWKDLFDKGVCLFGGPVLDPKGVYGILVFQAPSEEEARVIAAADPTVKAKLNTMELAEIKIAFMPKAK